jgi:uncharacterized protein
MNRRLGIALVAFVLWTAITIVGGNITTGGKGTLLEGVTSGIGWTWVVAAAFILAVVLWQGWRDVGLDRLPEARSLKLTWLPMIYIVGGLVLAAVFGLPPATVLLLTLVNSLLVGLSEELMFRGAMLQGFRHAVPIWPAVLLTSVAFGAVHSLNVFVTGDLKGALIQSSAAFLSGLIFIALRLRTGSLWPSIIVHALWDFATFTLGSAGKGASHAGAAPKTVPVADPSSLQGLMPILLVLPNAIYGLWLMRHIGRTHTDPAT